jgi:site-specific DNA-methyltransferase (adenine-specific)
MNVDSVIGDVVEWAKNYNGPKFHALLSDPPYHLTSIVKRFGKENCAPAKEGRDGAFKRLSKGFMGQEWDGGDIAFRTETWQVLGNCLLPGAFGMAYASSRGFHRMAVAIEDAGMIIHPMFGYCFASGFPKATRVKDDPEGIWKNHRYGLQMIKPALEPIIVFQKPYELTPLKSIKEYGSGTLNIEGARIGNEEHYNPPGGNEFTYHGFNRQFDSGGKVIGRWPSNLVIEENLLGDKSKHFFNFDWNKEVEEKILEESQVNLEVKPTTKERNAGLDNMPDLVRNRLNSGGLSNTKKFEPKIVKNDHPSIKPISLNTHLATLLLPPGRYSPRKILIPFAGVYSEVIGTILAGWDEITAIEISEHYTKIGIDRLNYWNSREDYKQGELI